MCFVGYLENPGSGAWFSIGKVISPPPVCIPPSPPPLVGLGGVQPGSFRYLQLQEVPVPHIPPRPLPPDYITLSPPPPPPSSSLHPPGVQAAASRLLTSTLARLPGICTRNVGQLFVG